MSEMTAEGTRDLVGDSPTILEIGCNDGTDTNRFLKAMPGATIYCFEPDPRAIARFRETVSDDRVTLIKAAVADFDGPATFHGSSGRPPESRRSINHYCRLDEWDLSGSLCKPTGHLNYSDWVTFPKDREYQVQVLRLDTWLACTPQVEHVDFIWCDVQGAEGLVIQGAQGVLDITDYFYTEFRRLYELYDGQPSLIDLRKMLLGFEFLKSCGGDKKVEGNVLFKNQELT